MKLYVRLLALSKVLKQSKSCSMNWSSLFVICFFLILNVKYSLTGISTEDLF